MGGVIQADSVASSILRRIRGWGPGSVFVPRDFLDLGARGAVDVALHRMVQDGVLRRLGRGLYDYPKVHPTLGVLTPSLDDIAHALARSNASAIVPSDAASANALGLSTQVPAQAVYLTDGPGRTVRIGTRTVRFAHASPGRMLGGDTRAGAVIRGLRFLGRDDVTDAVVRRLQTALNESDRRTIRKLMRDVPAWMVPILDRLTTAGTNLAA